MNLQNNPNLTAWLQNQEQPLPESLKMTFVDRALEELKNSEEARKRFNKVCKEEYVWKINFVGEFFTFTFPGEGQLIHENKTHLLLKLEFHKKLIIIQTLLSRIDGKAVLPFLDVESKEYNKKYNNFYDIIENGISTSEDIHNFLKLKLPPQTLQEQMSLAFWRALSMEGKNVDEALEVITKIYLKELYV
jgi:hypothetical protein